tara:strand:+ start:10247 stop:11284 length:1038 start_codon:yes stop_codon:yes gene_type:complete
MNFKNSPILVTGCAGFIGGAFVNFLLEKGENVIGIDNLNGYYDINLKQKRIDHIRELSKSNNNWKFFKANIEDYESIQNIFKNEKPSKVVHLAAQAGVRYSIDNPSAYIQSNLLGFFNILEAVKRFKIENFIYASSSSVYGGNRNLPFNEKQKVNHPVSLYAATKKSNELLAHSYSHINNIPSTGLRFFTVYGPWGRPDMAPMIFAKSILENKPIKIFNYGDMMRDFTYIDDVVEGIYKCLYKPAYPDKQFDLLNPDPSTSFAPHRIFNLGNGRPIKLLRFIDLLEEALGKKAIKEYMPIQLGDVKETSANTELLKSWIDYSPNTPLEVGIKKFAKWFINYNSNT